MAGPDHESWCFSKPSKTELVWFSPCFHFPPGKMVNSGPELIVQEESPGHQPSLWRRAINKGSQPARETSL